MILCFQKLTSRTIFNKIIGCWLFIFCTWFQPKDVSDLFPLKLFFSIAFLDDESYFSQMDALNKQAFLLMIDFCIELRWNLKLFWWFFHKNNDLLVLKYFKTNYESNNLYLPQRILQFTLSFIFYIWWISWRKKFKILLNQKDWKYLLLFYMVYFQHGYQVILL